ncbi:MAG: hypothetical protein ACHQF2_03690 [Flavobacteriales bacterium]
MTNSLDKYNHHQKIISDTVMQINKDLGSLLENPAKLTGTDTPYNELYQAVYPVVDKLLGENRTQLMQLLYRIDIPESFMKKIPSVRSNAVNYVTNGILERELQKVVIRHNLGTGK